MTDQPTTRDQLIEQAATALHEVRHPGWSCPGPDAKDRKAAQALADAGLLADPEQHAELEKLRVDAVEVKRLDNEAYLRHREALYGALGCTGVEGSLIVLITENVAAVVAERDALQARIDAALAKLARYDTSGGWQATHEIVEEAGAALQGDQPTEQEVRGG